MRSILCLLALLGACARAADAPTVRPGYRVGLHLFTADDGVPQSGVNAIVQTRDGYLWLGTFGGLARFDGLTFTTFRSEPGVEPDGARAQSGPASDRILALYEDGQRALWIGTQDAGLSVYRQGVFQHLPVCGGVCQVNAIFQAPDRRLWIASNVGLFAIDPALDPARQREIWIDPVRTGHVSLTRDAHGRVYVGGGEGLFVAAGNRLRPIALPAGDRWIMLLETRGDELLIGTDRALYRYRPDSGQWRPLGVARPTAAARDGEGRWWVATASGRMMRESAEGEWREVPELFDTGAASLARDDEGNLWIGSGSKGLLRVRRPLFGLLPVAHAGRNMAGRAVLDDGQGGLWLGSACGGLSHWRRDGTRSSQPLQPGTDEECVTSLALAGGGALLAGTADGRLMRVAQAGSAQSESGPRGVAQVGAWSQVGAINVWRLGDTRFLVSAGRSAFALDIDADGRVLGQRRIDALQGMNINNLIASARGGYWLAGDRGVWRWDGRRVVERWTPAQGLSSRFARALYEDAATATLWVGTYGGGLNRIRGGRVQRYDSRNGLFDDTVSCILADERGRLWLGGNRGVALLPSSRAAAAKIESIGFAAGDGLVPAEINGGHSTACHRDARGRLWFSLVEGFAVLDPRDVAEIAPMPLRPRIEEVAVAGRRQKIAGSTLALEPFARSLEIHYTAINLSRPRDTFFRFRLLGFDHDWVEAGQNRSILYPVIPWGEHWFEVQARSQGGPWSPVAARLRIFNPQPWYLRPWVLILATALGLLVLVGATQFGTHQDRMWARKDE